MYPEYEWLFWKFGQAPINSWDSQENQLKYMTWLVNNLDTKQEKIGIKSKANIFLIIMDRIIKSL